MQVRKCIKCGRQWPLWRVNKIYDGQIMSYTHGDLTCSSCRGGSMRSFEISDGVLVITSEMEE